jgi:hypothetical protein
MRSLNSLVPPLAGSSSNNAGIQGGTPLPNEPASRQTTGAEFGASGAGTENYLAGCPWDPAPAQPGKPDPASTTADPSGYGFTVKGSDPQAKPDLPVGREGQGDGYYVDADYSELRRQTGHCEPEDEPPRRPSPQQIGKTHGSSDGPPPGAHIVRGVLDNSPGRKVFEYRGPKR